MSGGSFNYLYRKSPNEASQDDVERMIMELHALGAHDAASEVFDYFQPVRDELPPRLQAVVQAVEWWRSNDWGRDQVMEAIDKYRIEKGQ